MKLVIAVIQPQQLDAVRQELVDSGITRITVNRVTGHGRAQNIDLYRGQEVSPDLSVKVRLEIAVNKEFVEPTIEAILKAARRNGGTIGDGKIFVVPLEECVRIRTGERGGKAI